MWGQACVCERICYGNFITIERFTTALGFIENIPIVNVLYAYDAENSKTIILEVRHSIYLCNKMDDFWLNPIQDAEVDVQVDTCTKRYYTDDASSQLVSFLDEKHFQSCIMVSFCNYQL